MTTRIRLLLFAVLTVVLLGSATAFVLDARPGPEDPARAGVGGTAALDAVLRGPHVLFRNTDRAVGYGVVAAVPLSDPAGPRAYTDRRCDRLYGNRRATVCLRARQGMAGGFETEILDADWNVSRRWPLPGIPSRTRLSPDGSLVASTVFVAGHSYLSTGFSTQTQLRYLDGRIFAELEQFALTLDGRRVRPRDRNFWGVTFAEDGGTFYATAATGGRTWLVRGDLRKQTLTSVRRNAECPSLSPDGSRIAYKKRLPGPGGAWAIAVLDLAPGRETVLPETRGLDDQVEWLDDEVLLYALPRAEGAGTSDIWAIRVRPGAQPTLFIPQAVSPAVVR